MSSQQEAPVGEQGRVTRRVLDQRVHGDEAIRLHREALDLLQGVVDRVHRMPVRARADLHVPLGALQAARSAVAQLPEFFETEEEASCR
jgi:hypothetical protein